MISSSTLTVHQSFEFIMWHPTVILVSILLLSYLSKSEGANDPQSPSISTASSSSNDMATEEENENDSQVRYEQIVSFDSDKLVLEGCSSRDFPSYSARGQESTLRQVLIIHRHGDRTPIKIHSEDPLANEPFWQLHGLGQLTNRGKARIHLLGRLMRQRYGKFMKGSVSKSMILSRSSGVNRCIESAQLFLSGLIPLNVSDSPEGKALNWYSGCEEVGELWQPASIQTMSKTIDGMVAEGRCKELKMEYERIDKSRTAQAIYKGFSNEAKVVRQALGYEIDIFYKWFWASSETAIERSYFHDKLDPRIVAIYDKLQEAGKLAWIAYQSTIKSKRLRSGLLIKDMVEHMKRSRRQRSVGEIPRKFIHYSTHDINVFTLLGVLGNVGKFPFAPGFGASIIAELHEGDNGEWFVKFFYMPQVPSKLYPIHVEGCEYNHPKKLCTLDSLEEVMKPYIIKDWISWMQECKNNLDNIDPYAL